MEWNEWRKPDLKQNENETRTLCHKMDCNMLEFKRILYEKYNLKIELKQIWFDTKFNSTKTKKKQNWFATKSNFTKNFMRESKKNSFDSEIYFFSF